MNTITPEHAAAWPQPLVDPESAGFWESTARGVLAISRCRSCSTWMHRPLERCRVCAGPVSFEPVTGRGSLHTWIVVNRQSIPGPAVPYLIGVADLEEDAAIRVSGILQLVDGVHPRVGMPVMVTLESVPGGDFVAPVILAT